MPPTDSSSAIRSICVYCGSRPGADPRFAEMATALGREMARRGIGLVYGGGHVGLMGVIADAVLEGGGSVVGVIPQFMVEAERAHPGLTEQITVQTMHERKQIMSDRCDAIITMPGGVGTFDELFEAITWNVLSVHDRPIGVLDVGGYYEPLKALIDHGVDNGFISREVSEAMRWSGEPAALLESIISPAQG